MLAISRLWSLHSAFVLSRIIRPFTPVLIPSIKRLVQAFYTPICTEHDIAPARAVLQSYLELVTTSAPLGVLLSYIGHTHGGAPKSYRTDALSIPTTPYGVATSYTAGSPRTNAIRGFQGTSFIGPRGSRSYLACTNSDPNSINRPLTRALATSLVLLLALGALSIIPPDQSPIAVALFAPPVSSSQSQLTGFGSSNDSESQSDSSRPADPDPELPDSGDDPADGSEPGVIYARVSSTDQAENGRSLDEQVRRLREIATRRDIRLVQEPIRDEGETGRTFDRRGIQQVWHLARRGEISYVLVDDIDRIGRHAAETIFYLYELRCEFEVTLVTSADEELDVDRVQDLTQAVMKALSSQMANENRARRAQASVIEKFKEKNWSVIFNTTPLGYALTEDDWLRVDPEEADVVRTIFEQFLEVDLEGAYSATADALADRGYDLSSRTVKHIVSRPVYIGKPTVDTTHPNSSGGPASDEGISVADPDLQIINEGMFERAAAKVERITERYSSGSGDDSPADIDDLVDKFGFRAVAESSPVVQLQCPDCGGALVKNGQRTLSERYVHNYLCKECGTQRKFPTEREWANMNGLS